MTAVIDRPPYAVLRTMRARVAVLGPLDFIVEDADFRQVPEFATLHAIAPRRGQCYACRVDADFVDFRQWWLPLQETDETVVFHYAGPVHGGGGSDPLRIVLTLAVLIAAPYATTALVGINGAAVLGATGVNLVTAAIGIAGVALVNTLLPPPSIAGGFNGSGQSASPTYTAALQGNRARLREPIPVRYGQERFVPDEAALPYSEHDNVTSDQYYCTTLCVGYGRFKVLRIELDDTDHRYFANVAAAICGPGQTSLGSPYQTFETLAEQTIVADNMVTAKEVGAQELINAAWVGAFCPTAPGYPIGRVFFDVALRLATIDEDDGRPVDRTIDLQFRARRINDAGQPISGWQLLGTQTIVNGNLDTVRRSFSFAVQPGRYQFAMRRTQLKSDNQRAINDVQWIGLRGQLTGRGVLRDDCTYIVLRVRANEQLSGSQRRVNVVAQRLIPVYDTATETWSDPQFTRNAAHAFADALHDTTTGRGLPDRRIDLLGLADLADTLDERQDRFDYSFDSRVTVNDALQLIARSARSRPNLRRGSVYTMVRDELQTVPVALFMPRNMQANSFRLSFKLPLEDAPDAVRMSYRDGKYWDERVVWGQIHNGRVYAYPDGERPGNLPDPSKVQDERIAGVIGQKHALREVIFLVADAFYRRQPVEWLTGLEGTLPAYGSLVGTAHDVAHWGQSGDVADYDAVTRTLTTSEPLTFGSGAHYVRLQSRTGGAGEAIQVTAGATPYEMVLAAGPSVAVTFRDASRERTRYLFGSLSDVTRYARVKRLRRQGEHDVKVEAVIEVPAVHTADNQFLPQAGEIQDPLDETVIVGGDVDGDPYFGAVVFLPMLQGGVLVDRSPAEHEITVVGDIALTSASSADVGYYEFQTGSDHWIEVPYSDFFKFGSQPWTWEGKWNLAGPGDSFEPLLEFRHEPAQYGLMMVRNEKLALRGSSEYIGEAGDNVPRGVAVELALTYDGNLLRGFIDGQMQFEVPVDISMGTKRRLRMGVDDDGDQYANARNYRVRITAGVCRYTGNYTVPARYPTQ